MKRVNKRYQDIVMGVARRGRGGPSSYGAAAASDEQQDVVAFEKDMSTLEAQQVRVARRGVRGVSGGRGQRGGERCYVKLPLPVSSNSRKVAG